MTAVKHDLISDEDLLQQLANAERTAADCAGHQKTYRNEQIALRLRAELNRRRVKIPEIAVLWKLGRFNGQGAS